LARRVRSTAASELNHGVVCTATTRSGLGPAVRTNPSISSLSLPVPAL
jgi:hypothetical protein